MKVLVAEDDFISAEILANSLTQFGYDVTRACNGREAFEMMRTGEFRLVISDWEMPEMSGVEFCKAIRQRQWSGYIYVILLTSKSGVANVVEGLNAGADDFLTKPFQPDELRVRLRVGERIMSLESRDVTIFALAKLAESRDRETGAHLERMREYCRILGHELSQSPKYQNVVDGDYVQLLYLTSPLHDIGKVGIPDAVLLKPGQLTSAEFEIMKRHSAIGGATLEAATRAYPDAPFLSIAREIALTHHERYNGTGYPNGLRGEEIPLSGRIVAVADVYDALTTRRVYKPKFSHEKTRNMIISESGEHFDPDIVDAFLAREQEFIDVSRRFADSEDAADDGVVTPLSEPVDLSLIGSVK